MKKIIIIMSMLVMIVSCTAEDIQRWQRVEREKRERGKKCVYDYYGNIMCGYTRQNRKEQINNGYISIKDNVVYEISDFQISQILKGKQ